MVVPSLLEHIKKRDIWLFSRPRSLFKLTLLSWIALFTWSCNFRPGIKWKHDYDHSKSILKANIWNFFGNCANTEFLLLPCVMIFSLGKYDQWEIKVLKCSPSNTRGQYGDDLHSGTTKVLLAFSRKILLITLGINAGGGTIQLFSFDQFWLNASTPSVPGHQYFELNLVHLLL